jgi:hypothetical protein
MTRVCVQVTLTLPEGATPQDVQEYVKEAVTAWAGSLQPGADPMFDLDPTSVLVGAPLVMRGGGPGGQAA